jgi:Fe-S-cluster containining protein
MPKKQAPIEVENAQGAQFECVYPSCGGICCKNGRPGVEPGERKRIEENLDKFLPHLTPHARRVVEKRGFVTKRIKDGNPMLAVSESWCVFFNEGCVLHKVGASEGDRWKYKPWYCVVFPLAQRAKGKWYVRQWEHRGEAWDLFCLDPKESPKRAVSTLAGEIAFANGLERGDEAWRERTSLPEDERA